MSTWVPALLAGLAALGEAMIGLGMILPGETTLSAIAATVGRTDLIWVFVGATLGACGGDQINYWLGRRAGPRLRASALVGRIGRHHWDRGVERVNHQGARAVIGSRLVPVLRTMVPVIAGAGRLPFPQFTLASFAGSAIWAAVWVVAGASVATFLQNASVWVLGLLLGVAGVWWWRRSHGRGRS